VAALTLSLSLLRVRVRSGVRFTVYASCTATERDPGFAGPAPETVVVRTVAELERLHAAGELRDDLLQTLKPLLPRPSLSLSGPPIAPADALAATTPLRTAATVPILHV
jgi:hypothetical protein